MSAAPIGGPYLTKTSVIAAALVAIMGTIVVIRLFTGLGEVTNLNNGFAWGLWIAYDVVAGTALACGGYAVALVVYVLNRGRYHPLVRPALLASMFGYGLGGLSVLLDIGRWWNFWHILWPSYFNPNSVMLEVALCIACYTMVLFLEFAPAITEWLVAVTRARGGLTFLVSKTLHRILNRVVFVFIALGMLLPTMHQSSLGTMLVPFGNYVHPLWQTPILPALYIVSAIGLGYAVVMFEATLVTNRYRLPTEARILAFMVKYMLCANSLYLILRLGDLAFDGKLGLVFTSGGLSVAFLAEIFLFALPVVLMLPRANRIVPRLQFISALSMMVGAVMYRIDGYLVAYHHVGWHYFPSVPEILLSGGMIAAEVLGYALLIKLLPVLHLPVGRAAAAPIHQ